MLRLLGALLIMAAGVAGGQWGAGRLKKRVRLLRGLHQGLLALEREMEYGALPLVRALAEAAEAADSAAGLFLRAAAELKQGAGRTGGEAWSAALAEFAPQLGADELSALGLLAAGLGQSDASSQLRSLELCRERLRVAEREAISQEQRLGRVWHCLGWGGAAVTVLLLL